MKSTTETQLNEYIESLKEKLVAAEERADTAEQNADALQRQLDSDHLGWSLPRRMERNNLPLPRLEMHWKREDEDGCESSCTYMLVYEHFLGRNKIAYGSDMEVIGLVMGVTRSSGSARADFFERYPNDKEPKLNTPFREWSHALSDSEHLKLPLYITTEDGDVAVVEKKKQTILKRGGKPL